MSPSRLVPAVLIRVVAFTALAVALLRWMDLPGDDDGLGTGLVSFLIMVVVAAIWGLVDGFRVGFVASLVTWLVGSIVAGLAIVLVATLVNGEGWPDDFVSSGVFFAFLIGLPAFVGFALGGIGHLFRRKPESAAAA